MLLLLWGRRFRLPKFGGEPAHQAGRKTATHFLMRRFLMTGFFAIVGLLLAGTIAAFLRYVSLWTVLTASLVFFGMLLTFLLGAFVGSDYALPWRKQRLSNQRADAAGPALVSMMGQNARKPQSQPEIFTFHR
jgi:hypothetical protein